MPTDLSASLDRLFDATTLARGKSYFNAGSVKSTTVLPGEELLLAEVKGNRLYEQHIVLAWSPNGTLNKASGICSCPMAVDCKHVVAAILAAEAHGKFRSNASSPPTAPAAPAAPTATTAAPLPTSPAKPLPLSRGLELWLNRYPKTQSDGSGDGDGDGRADSAGDYPATVKDRIRYVIDQNTDSVTINPVKVSLRKNGSIGPSRRRYDFSHLHRENRPQFVLPIDLRIFRLLKLSNDRLFSYQLTVADDEEGQTLMRLVLQTGRAYWQDVEGLPLHLGDERHGQFVWRDLGESQQLAVQTDGDRWVVPLPLTPAWYVDTQTGACGALKSSHPPEHAKWLASAPAVKATEADQVEQAMATMSQASVKLPRPKPVLQELIQDIAPKAVLTLGAVKAREVPLGQRRYYQPPFEAHQVAPMLRLSFQYDGHPVAADSPDTLIRHAANGRLQLIQRNAQAEAGHLDTLLEHASELGFYPARYFSDVAQTNGLKEHDLVLWPFDGANPITTDGGGRQALDFVENVVPVLKSAGWTVIIEPAWPCHTYEGAVSISGAVEQEEDSWFSIGLNFEVDGHVFDLLPVLTKLVQTIDEKVLHDEQKLREMFAGQRFTARLKNGQYARLPIEPLIPSLHLIRDLHERIHAGQAGAFSSFAQALAGSGIKFSGGQTLIELGARLRELAATMGHTNPLAIEATTAPDTFKGELRPYQKIGMAWMLALADTGFGGILADDMGLGKTVQTLAYLAVRRDQLQRTTAPNKTAAATAATTATTKSDSQTTEPKLPCLLVVPTSLVSNWVREAAQFVPSLAVLALHGPDRAKDFARIGEQDLVITTYPLLHRDHETLFAQFYDTVILDEAQNVKNPTSQVAKLIRQINAKHRLALTGTPMENNLEELWCLFDWLIPGLLGTRKSFGERFRKPIEKEKNLGRQVDLSRRIAPFLMRRTKDQVVTDLPPRTEIVEAVELTGPQRGLYETVRATMHERVREALSKKGLASSRITVLDALLKLRQACCDPQLVKLKSTAKITTSAKRSRLIELLESLFAEGRRVLVFSQFVEMLRLIEADVKAKGWNYLMLTGQTFHRGELVKTFQEGSVPLFLISLKAGGVGLNLTAADTVILYDPWWNPAIERQAMDRVHRIGQDKPVFVHRLIAQGTVETKITEMQARKQALMDAVFDPDATGPLDMSEEEILSLFAPVG